MNNHLIKLTILNIIIGITIAGCGGGEEEESAVAVITKTQVVTEPTITTSELVSDPDFDFISNTDVDITVPVSPSTTVSYFINICTDFRKENNELEINYDSCKLRTTLTTLEQQFTLSLSNTELMLVAQIWPIKDGGSTSNALLEYNGIWPKLENNNLNLLLFYKLAYSSILLCMIWLVCIFDFSIYAIHLF